MRFFPGNETVVGLEFGVKPLAGSVGPIEFDYILGRELQGGPEALRLMPPDEEELLAWLR